jgi:hypothetical protein
MSSIRNRASLPQNIAKQEVTRKVLWLKDLASRMVFINNINNFTLQNRFN